MQGTNGTNRLLCTVVKAPCTVTCYYFTHRELVPDTPPCTRLNVGGLTQEEARCLLRRCSGLDAQATLPPSADGVVKVRMQLEIYIFLLRGVDIHISFSLGGH